MVGVSETKVLTSDGWEDCSVVETKNLIPIVDIQLGQLDEIVTQRAKAHVSIEPLIAIYVLD